MPPPITTFDAWFPTHPGLAGRLPIFLAIPGSLPIYRILPEFMEFSLFSTGNSPSF